MNRHCIKKFYLSNKLLTFSGLIRDIKQEWTYSAKMLKLNIYNTKIINITILEYLKSLNAVYWRLSAESKSFIAFPRIFLTTTIFIGKRQVLLR